MDSCYISYDESQPNLVQPQSTAEVTAVPKMEETHLILFCFWANAFMHLWNALASVSASQLDALSVRVCLCLAFTQIMFSL